MRKNIKKLVILCLAAYILGIIAFDKFNISILISMCMIAVLMPAFRCAFSGIHKCKLTLVVCIFFVLGAVCGAIRISNCSYGLSNVSGESVTVEGRVLKADIDEEFFDSYEVKILTIEQGGKEIDHNNPLCRVLLRKAELQNPYIYKYGDVIRVTGEVLKIEGPYNENEMNYAKISLADGIMYEISAQNRHSEFLRNDISYFNVYDMAHCVRSYIIAEIDKYFTGNEASLLKGMLVSEKDFSKDYYTRLSDCGMTHITVASGFHVGSLCAFVLWLCFAVCLRKRYTYTVAICLVWMFAFVEGLTPSITRAAIMLTLFMVARLTSRDYDKMHTLFLTAFAMVILNPYVIYDVGFVLSFSSVMSIYIFEPHVKKIFGKVTRFKSGISFISMLISVQILLVPLIAFYFNKVSPYVIVANMLISPVMAITLVSGFVFAALSFAGGIVAGVISFVVWILLKYINIVIYVVSSLPGASKDLFGMDMARMSIYYLLVGALGIFLAKGRKSHAYICLTLAGIITAAGIGAVVYESTYMRVDFINVGQADATLIQFPWGKNVVIDGGGSSPLSKRDIGEEIFVPYLKRKGINKIDCAVLSHYDKDHAQGIVAALRLMKVENLILPIRGDGYKNEYKEEIELLASRQKTNVMYVAEGDSFDIGGAHFEICSPSQKDALYAEYEENEKSLVIKMSYGETEFLFAGDMGEMAEGRILAKGKDIECDVLKVAHHGAEEATNTKFIVTSNPEYAIISVGKNNVYNHPSNRVLSGLRKYGARVITTADSGTVRFLATKDGIKYVDMFYDVDTEEKLYLKSGDGIWLKKLSEQD